MATGKGEMMAIKGQERDYVLGTHDEEIERLALQHRVWRPRASDAWRRAGFTQGQTILDVGCGPGHATLDLAEIVGQSGRVVALDRSRQRRTRSSPKRAARTRCRSCKPTGPGRAGCSRS